MCNRKVGYRRPFVRSPDHSGYRAVWVADAITLYNPNEFGNVVIPYSKLWDAVFSECGRPEFIFLLPYVGQFMFHERAELNVRTLSRVMGVERDQVGRDSPEPFLHLLFLPTFLPCSTTKGDFFALADYPAHLAFVLDGSPEVFDIGVVEMFVILVVKR